MLLTNYKMTSLKTIKRVFARQFGRTTLLMVVTLMISIPCMSQTIRFGSGRTTIQKAIETIESQTNYRVSYNNSKLDVTKVVPTSIPSGTVDEVMPVILAQTGYSYRIDGNYIVIIPQTNQAKTVSNTVVNGTVTDEKGVPVIGAGVMEAGTNNGTVTDASGRFSLPVRSYSSSLEISCIGYKTLLLPVQGRNSLSVVLAEDTEALDEVVVVGFGTQKKVNLTGAVATVDSKQLQDRPVQNLTQALQGQVPGLNINVTSGLLDSAPSMDIRGTGTIGTGSTAAPLVLIDGVEGDLSMINPQNVENISILKDAAASSIYGSRAPFGVILVTTKKGDAGHSMVNYNNNFRWNGPTMMPESMDSYNFIMMIDQGLINYGSSRYSNDDRVQRIKDYIAGKITTVNVIDPANKTRWANPNGYGNASSDVYHDYFNDWSFSQEHNLSVSGGSGRVSYYVGMGYMDQNGLLKLAEDSFKKYTPTARIDAQINDWIHATYSTRFTRTDYGRPTVMKASYFQDLGRQNFPWRSVYDDNGFIQQSSPALTLIEGGRTNTQHDKFANHGALDFEPVKNWVTTVSLDYNVETNEEKAVNLKTYNHDANGNPYIQTKTDKVQETFWKRNFLTLNAYTTYSFTIGKDNNFKVMAGMQYEDLKYRTHSLSRVGLIINELPVIDLTTGLDYNGVSQVPVVKGSDSEWKTAGYFGRFNYDYAGKYLFEANIRYDGSSRFRSESRYDWFPSFSAGWNISKEDFWDGIRPYVNFLKIRASYGSLGNQNTTSWYPTYSTLILGTSNGTWLQNGVLTNTAAMAKLISSSLTWETIKTIDAGLDFGAFDNRLTGSFDIYERRTLNMVGPAQELPNILGADVPVTNNTDLKTHGFELSLGWRDQLSNGFAYGANFILSDNQTIITRYPNATKSLNTYYEGQKLGDIWGYETIGIAKTQEEMDAHLASLPQGGQAFGTRWAAGDIMYKDLNGDGQVSAGSSTYDDPGDRRIIGNSSPRFRFGLDLNASWKGFDLRVFFHGVAKRDWWTSSYAFWGSPNENMWYMIPLVQQLDYFRASAYDDLPANTDSYYPRPIISSKNNAAGSYKNQQVQTKYLQNAAYLRLKNVTFGYTLPSRISQQFKVSNLRFFVSGENLWTLTKLANMFDPEGIDGINTASGLGYPIMKTVSAGVSVTL